MCLYYCPGVEGECAVNGGCSATKIGHAGRVERMGLVKLKARREMGKWLNGDGPPGDSEMQQSNKGSNLFPPSYALAIPGSCWTHLK